MVNIEELKRNQQAIQNSLFVSKDKSMIAKEDLTVYYPERYEKIGLTSIGDYHGVVGCFIIVNSKNEYAIFKLPNLVNLTPSIISKDTIDGDPYVKLGFIKDTIFMASSTIAVIDNYLNILINEFFILGKTIWGLSEDDLLYFFKNSGKYTGSSIEKNTLSTMLIYRYVARSPNDPEDLYPVYLNKLKGTKKENPRVIGLSDINYLLTNNLQAISGSYLSRTLKKSLSEDTTERLRKDPSLLENIVMQ